MNYYTFKYTYTKNDFNRIYTENKFFTIFKLFVPIMFVYLFLIYMLKNMLIDKVDLFLFILCLFIIFIIISIILSFIKLSRKLNELKNNLLKEQLIYFHNDNMFHKCGDNLACFPVEKINNITKTNGFYVFNLNLRKDEILSSNYLITPKIPIKASHFEDVEYITNKFNIKFITKSK